MENTFDIYYSLLKEYKKYYGNIEIKINFRTFDGINYDREGYKLGEFISRKRRAKKEGTLKPLEEEKLSSLGMRWGNIDRDKNWLFYYSKAKEYFNANNNLDIKVKYEIDGIKLGAWLSRQKVAYKNNLLSDAKIKLLEAIGIKWYKENDDKWTNGFNHLLEYYNENKSLNIPPNYRSPDGFSLWAWYYKQKEAYRGAIKDDLTIENIKSLENLNIKWFGKNINNKLIREEINLDNRRRKRKEIKNRACSVILSFDEESLPTKEEINKEFIKRLTKI